MNVRDVGEERLLDQLLTHLARGKAVVAGPGDDCAVVKTLERGKLLVLKTDCVIESVHFLRGTNGVDIGWKAMVRPLSDFAATSAVPRFAMITLMVPSQTTVAWVKKLYQGLHRAARRFGVMIIGGETSSTPGPISVSVSVVGFVEKNRWVSRHRGKPGDDIFVTGRLGGAVKQKHLHFIPRIAESRWLTQNFSIHAMMDLSDGLGADLPRLARASRVGFELYVENLPLARGATVHDAISEGEDYELLFAVSPRDRNALQKQWRKKFSRLPLTHIGSLSQRSAKNYQRLPRGYAHFQQPQ